MRMWLACLLALIVALSVMTTRPAAGQVEPPTGGPPALVAPEVEAAVQAAGPQDTISVIVRLRDQADLSMIPATDRANRLRAVVMALRAKADASQRGLRGLLATRLQQGSVKSSASFWIFNGFAVTATRDVILELAARPEVLSIEPDRIIQAPTPPTTTSPSSAAPETNVGVINAPAMWDLGFRGQGVVVASMDTGVDYTHPDLAPQWRGGGNSWYDPWGEHPTQPTDVSGHGTWTMGVMVGGDNGGTAIGVAPQASWIAAKIFNDGGTSTSSAIHQGFQWLLDPDGNPLTADAPHVVNNSWSFNSPGCILDFEPDLQSLVAAGIAPVFAAGNFGPNGSTSASPANNPDAVAVGAVDNGDVVASSSSRGPTDCGTGSARAFPDLVAPGVSIRTSDLFGLYFSPSGTSMSAPHVSGALALLLGARPGLTVEQQRVALSATALDLGPAGPDDTYGAGRIDVLAAYSSLAGEGPLTSNVTLSPDLTNGSADVALNAVIDDATTGGSNVDAAEYFIDTAGAEGSGVAMTGAFDSPTVSVSAAISPDVLAGLASGSHTFYVHGHDTTGSWGPMGTADLVIDRDGPSTSQVAAAPNPTAGSGSVTLTATAADPPNGNASPSNVAAAEWFEGPDPGAGNGSAMQAADGAFDGPTENLTAAIGVSGWTTGDHTLLVRAKDAAGNWGPLTTATLTVQASDIVFADGFETGGFGAWTSVSGDAARISVAPEAAQSAVFGMKAVISGNTPSYVTDATPAGEAGYHARFYFHPNGTTTRGRAHDIFTGRGTPGTIVSRARFRLAAIEQTIFRVQYRRTTGGLYQVRAGVLRKGGTTFTNWQTISNASHAIEIAWQSGTSAAFDLHIDGALRQSLTRLNTSAYLVDSVRLGPSEGLSADMSGAEYYDAFVSTRNTYIGP